MGQRLGEKGGVKLNRLSLQNKVIFVKYLNHTAHELSAYAFENIYIWKKIFDIYWILIQDNLCVFFKDKIGCFLYLPPQGKQNPQVMQKVFEIMDDFNKNKDVSRIENVEQRALAFYQNLGCQAKEKFGDYLCQRQDLVSLRGNKFKSKRACLNYFIKHYKFEYLPSVLKYKNACLGLYDDWMKTRETNNQDMVYQGMLGDSRVCLKVLLDAYQKLDIIGRVVKIDRQIKAFSFGYKLNRQIFCILYEITDLSIRGLSQFIFHRFCRELSGYKYINIMDDSGLENLRKVKLSYRPVKLIPSYIVTRKNVPR